MAFGFFEDDLGNKSIARAILVGVTCTACGIAGWLHTQEALVAILTFGATIYSGAKTLETVRNIKTNQSGGTGQ